MDRDYIIIVAIIILSNAINFFLGYGTGTGYINLSGKNIPIEETSQCTNQTLSETAICLKEYVASFYNYTFRDERVYTGEQGSLEDIKRNGGDCSDYSKIYKDNFIALGYESETIEFFNDSLGHAFTLAWTRDISEYCILDQLIEPKCFRIAFSKDERG